MFKVGSYRSQLPIANDLLQNLTNQRIFAPTTLAHLRDLISSHCHSPDDIYTFSPLPSFSRIIITFHNVDSAIAVRSALSGETFFDSRIRVYFGEPTHIAELEKTREERQLRVPKSEKQFFISPPPSPPHGWESKEEDPPNKDVHAEDLADALHRLERRAEPGAPPSPTSPIDAEMHLKRSGSTLVYDPHEHGDSPDLPAIQVVDTTFTPGALTPSHDDENHEMIEAGGSGNRKILAHTSRPPVELINES